jgi:putative DNA primase/helicase
MTAAQVARQHNETPRETVARLAALHPLEYEQVRESEANLLGVRVGTLDKEINVARRSRQEESGKTPMFPMVEPWQEPVNARLLLDEILEVIQKYIVCERETAQAATLWIAFTWLIDHFEVAPLAVITAPEKRCGKTQLLNLMGMLSQRPLMASNISSAATFRVIEAYAPTLLIDEADTFLKENEALRGIINSGHTRQSAYVIRTVGDNHEPQQFSTWGAKAISGLGTLPETVTDRAIILSLRRKLPHEVAQRLRHADQQAFKCIVSKLARFAEDAGSAIACARPLLPEELNDRAQDNWEPLLAIAEYAGGNWPDIARETALHISGAEQEVVSLSVELLADIREIFERRKTDKLSTADILQELCGDDLKPWATYNRGQPMRARQMANKLKEFSIAPANIRKNGTVVKGFKRSLFDDAFERYIIPYNASPETDYTSQNGDSLYKSRD